LFNPPTEKLHREKEKWRKKKESKKKLSRHLWWLETKKENQSNATAADKQVV